MVAKCANPRCNKEFRELNKGRLYLLPPGMAVPKLIDYCYWLCPDCASTFVIEREGIGRIRVVPRDSTLRSNQQSADATLRLRRGA